MAHRRFTIDLAIPETIPAALLQKPTAGQLTAMADMTWLEIVQEMIRRLKLYSQKINEGTSREEDTLKAKWHLCKHADSLPCEEEEDI